MSEVPNTPAGRGVKLRLTGAERFWYILQCIAFGPGYLAKVPYKKALSELESIDAVRTPKLSVVGYAPLADRKDYPS